MNSLLTSRKHGDVSGPLKQTVEGNNSSKPVSPASGLGMDVDLPGVRVLFQIFWEWNMKCSHP